LKAPGPEALTLLTKANLKVVATLKAAFKN